MGRAGNAIPLQRPRPRVGGFESILQKAQSGEGEAIHHRNSKLQCDRQQVIWNTGSEMAPIDPEQRGTREPGMGSMEKAGLLEW